MTSLRQIKANRCNTLKSTGPKTTLGKQHSRCNAMRHGLTAETVIQFLEDQEDYKAFELSVTADFDARTAVERQLVLRLAGSSGGCVAPLPLKVVCCRSTPILNAWKSRATARQSANVRRLLLQPLQD